MYPQPGKVRILRGHIHCGGFMKLRVLTICMSGLPATAVCMDLEFDCRITAKLMSNVLPQLGTYQNDIHMTVMSTGLPS